MSFILDALRKSEIERQRQSGPSIAEMPVTREDRRLPVALIAIGVLLAVNVGVLLFFLLRDGEPDAAAPTVTVIPPPAGLAPIEAQPAVAAPQPAPAIDPATGAASAEAEPPGVVYEEVPETYPSPGGSTLAAAGATTPDPTLVPDAPPPTAGGTVSYGDEMPQPSNTLPTEPVAGLPPLTVDLHVFTDNPAKRAVFINGRRYAQGATIAEGAVIEQITPDGAILSFRGRRFLLPRQ